MSYATEMLDSYPADVGNIDKKLLAECIQGRARSGVVDR